MNDFINGLRAAKKEEGQAVRLALFVTFRAFERRGLSLGQQDIAEIRDAVREWLNRPEGNS